MEQALETQRSALLRLLTGLAVALRFAALAPAVSMLPQWVRSYVAALLVRIEAGVQSLVIVAACGLLRQQAAVSPVGLTFPDLAGSTLPEDGGSTEALLRRIEALRAMLEDLPRHAKRLIARLMKSKAAPCEIFDHWNFNAETAAMADAPVAARIERPPDKRTRPNEWMIGFAPS